MAARLSRLPPNKGNTQGSNTTQACASHDAKTSSAPAYRTSRIGALLEVGQRARRSLDRPPGRLVARLASHGLASVTTTLTADRGAIRYVR